VPGGEDDAPPTDLDRSLASCTAHRQRILEMLQQDPGNPALVEVRDQLSAAIAQLQGTQSMVQRAGAGACAGLGSAPRVAPGGAVGPNFAPWLTSVATAGHPGGMRKSHSSRKNKQQRCSVCGGVGHKSRTCQVVGGDPRAQSGEAPSYAGAEFSGNGAAPSGIHPAGGSAAGAEFGSSPSDAAPLGIFTTGGSGPAPISLLPHTRVGNDDLR